MNNENKKIISYDPNTGQPIYEEQPVATQNITGYNPNTGQPIHETQPASVQVPNQNVVQQPLSQPTQTQPKNNKNLYIILGIVGVVVLGIIILLVVLLVNKTPEPINDFVNNDSNDTITTISPSNNSTINYNGYEFTKKSGYEYYVDEDALYITSDTYATQLFLDNNSLEKYIQIKNELLKQYEINGLSPKNLQVKTYNGTKVLTIEISNDSINGLSYIIDASNGYSFVGTLLNSMYTIDYNDINKTVELLSDANYTGSTKSELKEDRSYEDIFNIFEKNKSN